MDLTPIYFQPITSLEGVSSLLGEYLDDSERVNSISEVFSCHFRMIEGYPKQLSGVFKIAFCGTWGFSGNAEVEAFARDHHLMVKKCVDDCKETSSLIVNALRCYREAAEKFTQITGPNESKIDECADLIGNTGEMANVLATANEEMQKCFRVQMEKILPLIGALNEPYLFLTGSQQGRSEGVFPQYSQEEEKLEKMKINALESSIKALHKIFMLGLHMITYFEGNIQLYRTVEYSDLFHGDIIERMLDGSYDEELYDPVKPYITVEPVVSLVQFVPSGVMRTSHGPVLEELSVQEKWKRKSESLELGNSIKEIFQSGFLRWLALAKAHQIMLVILDESIALMDKVLEDIQRIKQNPRAALNG